MAVRNVGGPRHGTAVMGQGAIALVAASAFQWPQCNKDGSRLEREAWDYHFTRMLGVVDRV